MLRRTSIAALLVVLSCATAWAGHPEKGTSAKQMEMMKAEMSKCVVCKNLAAQFDVLGPVLKTEAVKLNDGLVVRHWVTDPTKATLFHQTCDAMSKAGGECMTMTDEQAKTQLCSYCQSVRSAVKAGAKMSQGTSKNGDLMVLTSGDPSVQAQLTALQMKCEMMAGEQQVVR